MNEVWAVKPTFHILPPKCQKLQVNSFSLSATSVLPSFLSFTDYMISARLTLVSALGHGEKPVQLWYCGAGRWAGCRCGSFW